MLVRDGVRRRGRRRASTATGRGARRRRAASSRPGSSTCTCTCASRATRRPRRSRPARAPRRSAGSPRSSRCRTPTPPLDDAAVVGVGARAGRAAGCATWCRRAASRRAAPGEQLAPMGELLRPRRADLHRRRRLRRRRRRDAARARVRARRCPGAVVAQHAEDADPRRRRAHARGRVVEPARHPRPPGGGRDRRSSPATSSSPSSPARRVHFLHVSTAGAVELVRAAKARGPAGHRRGRAAPLHAHRRRAARASTRCSRCTRRCAPTPTSRRSRAGLADGTIDAIATDHAPHTPEAKERPFEEAPPGMLGLETALAVTHHRAGRARACCRSRDALGLLSWRPAAHRRARRRPRRPDRAGHAGQPLRVRPRPRVGGRPGAARRARSRNTPFAGRKLTGRVRHTVLRGEPVVVDGEAHAMSAHATRSCVLRRRRRCSRARRSAHVRHDGDGGRHRRGRVQHRAVGLPGDRHRPVVRGQIITFTYPHIGNYGVNADDDESRAPVLLAASSCATSPRRHSNWRATASARRLPRPPRRARHRRDRHPPPHPSPPRRTARCPARSAPTRPRCAPRPRRRAPHRRHRPRRRPSPPTEPYTVGDADAPFHVVAYDFGIKRTILRHLVGVGLPRRGGARRRRPPPTCSPASPTASSSRTGPATRPRSPARPTRCAAWSARCPVFGICLGHQILGLALGGRHLQAAVRPPRRQPPGAPRGDRPGRDHEPEPQLRGRRRLARPAGRAHPREPQRRRGARASGCSTRPRSRCSTTPRPGPVRTTPRYLFDDFTDADDARAS